MRDQLLELLEGGLLAEVDGLQLRHRLLGALQAVLLVVDEDDALGAAGEAALRRQDADRARAPGKVFIHQPRH